MLQLITPPPSPIRTIQGIEGDKSGSQLEVRVFKELEDDLSESLGTSLPTDLTLTTTMADHPEDLEEEEDTDENQNKVRRPIPRGLTFSRFL